MRTMKTMGIKEKLLPFFYPAKKKIITNSFNYHEEFTLAIIIHIWIWLHILSTLKPILESR